MSSPGSSTTPPLIIKLLLIGSSRVGKSAILLRFTDGMFLPETNSPNTLGVDFRASRMEVNGTNVKLSIWDTAGQERYRTITSSYYRNAQGIILVYDVTDKQSFEDLPGWLSEVNEHTKDEVVKILIGNKVDKEAERVVLTEDGAMFAEWMGMMFVEASAKTNTGVHEAFQEIVTRIVNTPTLWQSQQANRLTAGGLDSSSRSMRPINLSSGQPKPDEGWGCC